MFCLNVFSVDYWVSIYGFGSFYKCEVSKYYFYDWNIHLNTLSGTFAAKIIQVENNKYTHKMDSCHFIYYSIRSHIQLVFTLTSQARVIYFYDWNICNKYIDCMFISFLSTVVFYEHWLTLPSNLRVLFLKIYLSDI